MAAAYGVSETISERHRHRYEFNNKFREQTSRPTGHADLQAPRRTGELVETVEIPDASVLMSAFSSTRSSSPARTARIRCSRRLSQQRMERSNKDMQH